MNEEFNYAEIVRNIAENSDKRIGKTLKKIDEAAKNGLSCIVVKVTASDFMYLSDVSNKYKATPFCDKFKSLGFQLSSPDRKLKWYVLAPYELFVDTGNCNNYNYFTIISW